jgi:hypothetical protein
MLPEHAELLKELWEKDKKAVKPILDPQEMEMVDRQLLEAYEQQHTVTIAIHENGMEINYTGKIKRMDRERDYIVLKKEFGREIKISFCSLIRLTIN